MKKPKQFYSRITVFCPGNFVSVIISELDREKDYNVTNQQQFLDKFFDVIQTNPFCCPNVTLKPGYNLDVEFLITKQGRKDYEISLSKARVSKITYQDITL